MTDSFTNSILYYDYFRRHRSWVEAAGFERWNPVARVDVLKDSLVCLPVNQWLQNHISLLAGLVSSTLGIYSSRLVVATTDSFIQGQEQGLREENA